MSGHKPWSEIKTKMTPEMKFNAMAKAESLVQDILHTDKEIFHLPGGSGSTVEVHHEDEAQAYLRLTV